jgi:RHS repeat-associated protein
MPTTKGFTGQYADTSIGLDYYGARYYDPNLGQFTTADTAVGLNRYTYVAGNPETNTDSTGHRIDCRDGGVCGQSKAPPPHKSPVHATCSGLCKKVIDTFHDPKTVAVLQFLLKSSTGAKFVKFFLSAASYRFLGDSYITWTKPDQGDAYTNWNGTIQVNPNQLPCDPGKCTDAQLLTAAGLLVHEGVESYYDLGLGIVTQASQHMDYVAQYYAGKVKTELGTVSDVTSNDINNVAFGLSFDEWTKGDGRNYKSEPVNQPEVTEGWGQVLAFLARSNLDLDNAMGLTTDLLTSPMLPRPIVR